MLAIIIPYYKLAFFEATLQSLSAQTCQNFKVYIGDDASPERPSDLLEKYKRQFDFVYHRFETNLGGTSLTKQWERCIALSGNEEWLMILGDDDVLGEHVVEAFYEVLCKINTHQYQVMRFATKIINADGDSISRIYTHPILEKATDFLHRKLMGQTRSSLSEYVFNKHKLFETGFYDFPLAWYSDEMAILQCSNFGNIYTINNALVYIRLSSFSISGDNSNNDKKIKARLNFCTLLMEQCSTHFSVAQKIKIISYIEFDFYLNRNRKLFQKLFFWYLTKTNLLQFLKFIRRAFYINRK